MSANVTAGLKNPSGKPHPAVKLVMLMALISVVFLGIPHGVVASPPAVQAPTGPFSGGVFTGPYTFNTYVYCSSGLTLTDGYTAALDGTHTFVFQGAPDGSLLVNIDGTGAALLTSCGDPFATPRVTVATYTVTKGTPPTPTPTPSATPTPTPTPTPHTPTPVPGGGATPTPTKPGGGTTATPQPGVTSTPEPGQPTPVPTASASPSPSPSASPKLVVPVGGSTKQPPTAIFRFAWRVLYSWLLLALLVVGGLVLLFVKSKTARDWVAGRWFALRLRVNPYLFRIKVSLKRALSLHGRELPRRRGLSAHHHSGRLLAHHHTSYASLALLVTVSTFLMAAYSTSVRADVASQSLLSLTVLGPPPTSTPTIDQPVDGDTLSTATITVQGTCEAGLIVELYRNGSFAGSIACSAGGTYSMLASLVAGQNDLTVRHVDGLSQPGPSSGIVSVTYTPPPPTPTPSPSVTPAPTASVTPKPTRTPTPKPSASPKPGSNALTIDADQHFYQGGSAGVPVDVSVTVRGGVPPYLTTWDWGDGSEQAVQTPKGPAAASHIFKAGGMYRLVIRARDGVGNEAAITLLVVVNGGTGVGTVGSGKGELPGNLMVAWPILIAVILTVISFWLGENHRLAQVRFRNLRRRQLSPSPA